MGRRNIVQREWPNVDTVENVACEIKIIVSVWSYHRKRAALYGLDTVKRVLEQGKLWDYLLSVLLAINSEYLKDVTKHFKDLESLRETSGFSNYQLVLDFLSHWNQLP